MRVISLIQTDRFKADSTKAAFLKANKWVANNIVSKELNVIWNISKIDDGEVELKIYANVEVKEVMDFKCKACQAFHRSFYINQNMNCDRCNAQALIQSLKDKLKISSDYNKQKLNT